MKLRYFIPEIEIKFEPRDLWIGVYWNNKISVENICRQLNIYICVLPTFPIHFRFEWDW